MSVKNIRTKTLYMAAAFFLFVTAGTQLHAQSIGTPEERAKQLTDKMKEKLPLSDSTQYQSVYNINLKYADKQENAVRNAGSKMAKLKATKSVQQDKNKELKKVLSKEQYKKYEEMMKEVKDNARERFRSGRN